MERTIAEPCYIRKNILSNNIIVFLYSIWIFFIIFNPPFIKGFSFTIINTILCAVLCLVRFGKIKAFIVDNNKVRNFLILYFVFLIYVSLIAFVNASQNASNSFIINNIINLIIDTISILVVSLFFAYSFKERRLTINNVLSIFVLAGMYQAIIGLICFVSPTTKSFFNNLMVVNSSSSIISTGVKYTSDFRNYGFASTLFDIFGCSMSFLACLSLYLMLTFKKRYVFPFLLISFCAIINARTSIVMIGLGSFFLLLFYNPKSRLKRMLKYIVIVSILLASITMLYYFAFNESGNSWLNKGIREIWEFVFENNKTGYFEVLFDKFIFFPNDDLSILFGTSMTPEQAIAINSDVGYIQDIWRYGAIGAIFLYIIYLYLFISFYLNVRSNYRLIPFLFMILIGIYLIKLNCIGYSMAAVIYLPISLFSIGNGKNLASRYGKSAVVSNNIICEKEYAKL